MVGLTLRILTESTAVVLPYLYLKEIREREETKEIISYMLICNFGAGFIDISLLVLNL